MRAQLRLLSMSDLHAHLRDFDYHTDSGQTGYGLTRLTSLIRRARAEAPNSLLFDIGDLIQGASLGDWAQSQPGLSPHPMVAALNRLKVAAGTLGNHDFNFGLEMTERSIAGARYPMVCANAVRAKGASPLEDRPFLPPWALLRRRIRDDQGRTRRLNLGVIGFVPPQIMQWDARHLRGRLEVRGIVEAAQAHLPALRDAGADLVIALCHSGPGADSRDPALEQAATALAAVPGIDAILSGHAHRRFPGGDYPKSGPIDPEEGTLHGVPTVLPGHWGSDLGLIDLDLRREAGRWRVAGHRCSLRPVRQSDGELTPEDPALLRWSAPYHRATKAQVATPMGRLQTRLHTYFALLDPGPTLAVIAAAAQAGAAELLGPRMGELPLLAAVSSFKCGGRAGPDHFTDVAPGPVSLRHITDLYTYPNALQVVETTGAGLRAWLERSAAIYQQITPGQSGQPLLDPQGAAYESDTIFGVAYRIDLSQPARYDPVTGQPCGAVTGTGPGRVRDLTLDGRPLAPEARLRVVTNNYRASGGGNVPGVGQVTAQSDEFMRSVLARHLEQAERASRTMDTPWRFAPLANTSVILPTSPKARSAPEDIERLALRDLGDDNLGHAWFEKQL